MGVKELLEKKSIKNVQIEKQCIKLLGAWIGRKIYWYWNKKIKDAELDERQCQRARNYEKYFSCEE